jgi:M-phase inducer tyrosine phosphatase
LDARYQYEYEGGHINGAINISSFGSFQKLFQDYNGSVDYVIVYCEHSLYQGPLLIKSIFKYDEKENPNQRLFSKIFLLYGGYSTFYRRYKNHCQGKYVHELEISSKLELMKHDQLMNEMHLKVNENENEI